MLQDIIANLVDIIGPVVSVWQTGSVLVLIGWSFAVLCFAIINTHEKARQKYEADMAREIVSSGVVCQGGFYSNEPICSFYYY